MRRSRVFQAGLLLAVLIFVGAKAFRIGQQRKQSPFVMWEFRAGGRFSALEKSALRQTKQRFTCNDVVPSAKLCEMRVTGIGGIVRVLVNDRDRIAAVEFAPDSATPAMREETRRVAAEWNLVRRGASSRPVSSDTTATITRWRSDDGKWTAFMRHDRLGSTPTLVRMGDEETLAGIGESSPLASYVLALNGVIEARDVPNADVVGDVLGATMYRRATDPANETPSPRAPTTPLESCAPERSDPMAAARHGSLDGLTAAVRSLLERAIPAVYPGSRFVMGDGMWVVSPAGVSESIVFSEMVGVDSAGIVTGVNFRGRTLVATQRMEDAVADRFCRAPAGLLLARPNNDGSLADAHLVDVDPEALASDVLTIRVVEPDGSGAPAHIRVRYGAGYATTLWTGSIEWETVIADDPPRSTVRVPLRFAQQVRGGEEPADGYLVVTARLKNAIELATIERKQWGFSTRSIRVPVDSTGVLLGARILERLAAPQPAP
jgi:hypothetical protein